MSGVGKEMKTRCNTSKKNELLLLLVVYCRCGLMQQLVAVQTQTALIGHTGTKDESRSRGGRTTTAMVVAHMHGSLIY